jgi:hypothetical protein
MMESPPSVFKRGWEMLWEQPGAYFLVAILPHVAAIGLPILVGRLVVRVVHTHPPAAASWDPLTLWTSMGWGMRLLIILAMVAMATVPMYVVARGVCRLSLEQQRNVDIPLGAVLVDMLRFVPTAVFYFLALGIATFLGYSFLVVPGLLIASACALIIPAGIDGRLGPFAAIRRGISLVGRVFGRVLGVYASFLAFAIAGRVVLSIFTAGEEAPGFGFFVLLGLWFMTLLLAAAPVNIMVTLLYGQAREMEAPPLAAEAGAGPNTSEEGT